MESDKKEAAKQGYIADYTSGVYLSGIIILILSAIGFVATLRIPYEGYIIYPELMQNLLFSGFAGVILSLLFLLIKRKIVYLLFLVFLISGLISKVFLLRWAWAITGRFGGGIVFEIGVPLLVIIYLALKYKSAFIPVEKDEKIEKMKSGREPSRIWYFLPVLFGVIGGLIGFFVLKNRNWKMAKTLLGLGIAISVLAVGANSVITLMQPKPVTCNNPTDNFASGCELLLYYDADKDGVINLDELTQSYTDFENGVITEEEYDFVSDAYIADDEGHINALCPNCYTPEPITCDAPTLHFSSGCELLLHCDTDNDGLINLDELNQGYQDYEDGVIAEAEYDFVSDAYINGGINVVCSPGCFIPTPTPKPTPHIPEPYYLNVTEGVKDLNDLKEALGKIKYKHEYERHVFDCAEMSSLVEHHLENQGFNVSIVVHKAHAWVVVHDIVDVKCGKHNVQVECVSNPPVIISSISTTTLSNYTIFADIYEARDDGWYYAFDWWNVAPYNSS